MLSDLIGMLLAMVTTVTGGVLVVLTYGVFRQQSFRTWQREQRLPEATRFEHLKSLVIEEEKRLQEIRDQLYDARQTIDEAEHLKRWMEETKEEVELLQRDREEVGRLQSELENLQGNIAGLAEQKAALEAQLADLSASIQEIQKQREEFEAKARELEELKQNLEGLHRKVDEIREQITKLEADRSNLENEIQKLERDQEDRKHRFAGMIKELEEELARLQEQLARVEHQRDQRDNEVKQLTKQRDDLQKEIREKEGKLAEMKGQIPALQEAISSLAGSLPGSKKPGESGSLDLWNPVFPRSESSASQEELDAILHLESHLEHRGLFFHPRTVRAFHTSLKTTQSSPLVVLAGVSGTGKSELPRRYAEAMGMHFLNMAVQPRWDSPQDLFGFYDYLEQRFRPTELTRALVQMDPFYAGKNRGWDVKQELQAKQTCSDQMLLVLLDEMNLARVEYYFSEFLSRLETRRGIDLSNPREREKAEITLDLGGRQGVPPMRLFVGGNVLFVGTMNEDETTQALSDKVIDRANVLRFGSPANVDGLLKNSTRGQAHNNSAPLAAKTWSGQWVKKIDQLDHDTKNQVHDAIKRLREAMDRVNRPFAYRVAQGMLEYAANYPDPEQHLGAIISDQIEQKILPRLRGVDPTDSDGKFAFNIIDEILRNDCQDELLQKHLENCKRDNYFQWSGLDRTHGDMANA